MLRAGDEAPAFTARDQDGEERKLEDYRGGRLVLWFYVRADTPG